MESLLHKLGSFNYQEQGNIIKSLNILGDANVDFENEPIQIHIILGAKINPLEENLTVLKDEVVEMNKQTFKKDKKTDIQANVIKEMQENQLIKELEYNNVKEETEKLLQEIKQLEKENNNKEILIEEVNKEKELLIERCDLLEEKKKQPLRIVSLEKDHCETCVNKLVSKIDIQDHIQNKHQEEIIKVKDVISEETNKTEMFKCGKCDSNFHLMTDFRSHVRSNHLEHGMWKTKALEIKLELAEKKFDLVHKIYLLKEREISTNQRCNCKGFCLINHAKFSWKKSIGEHLKRKFIDVTSVRSHL